MVVQIRLYLEYDATAQCDDSSCATLIIYGCTDSTACNYDGSATNDDGFLCIA